MRLAYGDGLWRGSLPGVAEQRVPEGFAARAVNSRLSSGDLSAYAAPDEIGPLAKYSAGDEIVTIYPMRRPDGTLAWMHWTRSELSSGAEQVDVVRGPIVGNRTQRTYYTGAGAPRVTDYSLAVGDCGGEYPCDSLLLGVPAPLSAVDIVQSIAQPEPGDVTITNPSAGAGTMAGWTTTAGDMQAWAGPPEPYTGSYMFAGGTAARSTAHQRMGIGAASISPGTTLSLAAQVQTGGGDGVRVGITFRAEDLSVITEVIPDWQQSIGEWSEIEVSAIVPSEALYVDIVIDMLRAGSSGPMQSYVGLVRASVGGAENSWDGSSFDGWTILPLTRSPAIIGTGSWLSTPAPWWRMFSRDGMRAGLRRESYTHRAGAFSVRFAMGMELQGGDPDSCRAYVHVGSDEFGNGAMLLFRNSGVAFVQAAGWGSGGAAGGTIISRGDGRLDFAFGRTRIVTISGVRVGADRYEITYTVETPDGEVRSTGTGTLTMSGGNVAFVAETTIGDRDMVLWIDDVSIEITPPTADASDIEQQARYTQYVMTWVNSLGEESAPSPVSRTVQQGDGIANTVTMPTVPPTDRGVTHKRLYRYDAAGEVYRLVVEVDADDAEYVDQSSSDALGELLPSAGWDPPAEDMRGIIALPNGITVGYSGMDVMPSAQYRPHAYPVGFRLPTDAPIVGLGAIDTILVVLTQAHPYLVLGSTPDTLSMQKLEYPQGCSTARGIVSIEGRGVVYPSPDGLVGIYGTASPVVLTQNLVTTEAWQRLNPETIHAVCHDGLYFGFYEGVDEDGGFVFDPTGRDGHGWVWLNFYASAAYTDPLTDTLYFVIDGELYAWDRGDIKLAQEWTGRQEILPAAATFRYARVEAEEYHGDDASLTLDIEAAGDSLPGYPRQIENGREFAIPCVDATNYWRVKIAGTATVKSVQLVETIEEMI